MDIASENNNRETGDDDVVEEIEDILKECSHCGNHPCWSLELEPILASIDETYGSWKTNKQVRYLMYTEAVKHIFGTGLGKKVRKKVPNCVEHLIKKMKPDDVYTGFIPSSNDN